MRSGFATLPVSLRNKSAYFRSNSSQRDGVSQTNLSVFRIHLHSQWLIEIKERMLEFINWLIHALFGSFL